jgi:hypothetical protein
MSGQEMLEFEVNYHLIFNEWLPEVLPLLLARLEKQAPQLNKTAP